MRKKYNTVKENKKILRYIISETCKLLVDTEEQSMKKSK